MAPRRSTPGTIIRVNDSAIVQPRRGVLTQIEGVDTWRAAAYRLVSKSYPAGQTLKQIVTDLVTTYLTTYGITLDAGMATGPTMADVTFDYVSVESAFSTLSDLTGWVYRLLPSNVLEMFSIGSKTSSFSLTASNIRGGVRWGKTRGIYVNRQFVRAGSSAQVQKTWTVTGDGATNTWTLEYPGVQLPNGGLVVTSLLVGDSATGVVAADRHRRHRPLALLQLQPRDQPNRADDGQSARRRHGHDDLYGAIPDRGRRRGCCRNCRAR